MRSPSRTLPLALAIASGLATTGLMYAYLKAQPQPAPLAATQPPVVAATNLAQARPPPARAHPEGPARALEPPGERRGEPRAVAPHSARQTRRHRRHRRGGGR